MELRQLEYFVAVAEEANFTRAAARVHISQSGVSAQLKQLERELGASLIDRSSRKAALTPAGEAALTHARAALAAAAAVRQAVDEVNDLVRGQLVVGMVTACTITALFDALSAFHLDHPGVGVTLIEDGSDRLVERVHAGTVDLALIGCASAVPTGLEALPIVSDRLVACMPGDHPLAQRPRVGLADLVEFPIVCMPPGTGIRTTFDLACASRGLQATIALQASAPDAVADLAVRGLGVAVLSESMTARYEGHLIGRVIRDVDMLAVLALVWRRSPSPALRELLIEAHRAFAEPSVADPPPRRAEPA